MHSRIATAPPERLNFHNETGDINARRETAPLRLGVARYPHASAVRRWCTYLLCVCQYRPLSDERSVSTLR